MSATTKYVLGEDAIPTHWVNLLPDLPGDPLPPLNPQTGEPAGPDDLTPIFPMGLILPEVSPEPVVAIPDAVRDAYRLWRPTPLYRARRLGGALAKPPKIFYQEEGGSPAVPRPPAGGRARYAREDLLQVRGRLAGWLAQAEHSGPAGL